MISPPSFYEKHIYPVTLLEGHLDTFGHVNHAVYVSLFEEARWDMITGRGHGFEKVHATGIAPVVLEFQIKFRRELRLRQRVLIETEVTGYEKRVAIFTQSIVDEDGKTYCTAEFKFSLFDLRKRKLVLPPPDWVILLGLDRFPKKEVKKD